MRKLLKELRSKKNEFCNSFIKDKDDFIRLGICLDKGGGHLIVLNPMDIYLPVVIHELGHAIYPDKTEEEVEEYTEVFLSNLSRRQRMKIFMLWLQRISEEESCSV